jgi:hypothetical protein
MFSFKAEVLAKPLGQNILASSEFMYADALNELF